MKLVIQESDGPNGTIISLLLSPEGHAETIQLSELKQKALDLDLEHWDSDSNNLKYWTKADDWGFNLVLK